jgi:hypothetical protein
MRENLMKDRAYQFGLLGLFSLSLVIVGFFLSTPTEIIGGLKLILTSPATLITDYFGLGGPGATFVNAGLLGMIITYMLYRIGIHFNGATLAAIMLIIGFSFFGKNLINIWFIIAGVYLYAKVQGDSYSKHVYVSLFGTALAPMASALLTYPGLGLVQRMLISSIVGMSMGFILPPLATYMLRVHQGFNLYNVGFTVGVVGTIYVAVFKSFGFQVESQMIWTDAYTTVSAVILYASFAAFLFLGWWVNPGVIKALPRLFKYVGRLVTDFVILEGFGMTLFNMGMLGIMATTFVLAVGAPINGPVIGGILTVAGFGGFGKHPNNVWPIFAGVFLGSLMKVWSITEPGPILAALFGTALAPLAGEFGWGVGILTGFIHSSVVLSVGVLHSGLNLYNNGFSAGFVAAFLIPVIEAFKKESD